MTVADSGAPRAADAHGSIPASAADPLILTLRLDGDSFTRFSGERARFFPPARNIVPAHLTLFHHLPGERHASIARTLAGLAARTPPLRLIVSSLRSLGRGVAYEVRSPALAAFRGALAREWMDNLTRQDAQAYRPHVTIQNKVGADAASALLVRLSATFAPFEAVGTGVLLWRYRGGPWEAVGEFAFAEAPEQASTHEGGL